MIDGDMPKMTGLSETGFDPVRRYCVRELEQRDIPTSLGVAVGMVSLVLAIGLGFAAAGASVLPGDVEVATFIQRADDPVAGFLADVGNALGSTVSTILILLVALGCAGVMRDRPAIIFVVTVSLLRLIGTQLKPLFDSARPTSDLVQIVGIHDGTGYPSGHSLSAMTLALCLAVLVWRWISSRQLAIATVAVLVGLGLLIGWARIWSGAHWPSDVVGGFAFGAAMVGLGIVVMNWQHASERVSQKD